MKTKLLAMALLAGSSMFAQTRFSIGISIGGNSRSYYSQAPPAYAPAPLFAQGGFDSRYQTRGNEGYAQQGFTRGYDQHENRRFSRDRDDDRFDSRARPFDHDRDNDDGDDRGNSRQDYRQNGWSNGFRNR